MRGRQQLHGGAELVNAASRLCLGLKLSLKAWAAQNRRATGGLERNRCSRSTLGTIRPRFGVYPCLGASLGLAFLAAFRVVYESFFVEEKLLPSREIELGVAVNALQNPVRKFHGLLSTAPEIHGVALGVLAHAARKAF